MFSQVSLKLSPPHAPFFCFRHTYVPVDMPLSVGSWNWTYTVYRYNHLGFDGKDYMKLDLEGIYIYIPQIQEAANDADSWNNKTDLLQHFLQFITDNCIFFLHKYLEHDRTTFNRTGRPIAWYWSFLSFAVIAYYTNDRTMMLSVLSELY